MAYRLILMFTIVCVSFSKLASAMELFEAATGCDIEGSYWIPEEV